MLPTVMGPALVKMMGDVNTRLATRRAAHALANAARLLLFPPSSPSPASSVPSPSSVPPPVPPNHPSSPTTSTLVISNSGHPHRQRQPALPQTTFFHSDTTTPPPHVHPSCTFASTLFNIDVPIYSSQQRRTFKTLDNAILSLLKKKVACPANEAGTNNLISICHSVGYSHLTPPALHLIDGSKWDEAFCLYGNEIQPPPLPGVPSRKDRFRRLLELILHFMLGARNTIRSKIRAIHCWNAGGFCLNKEPHKDSVTKGRVKTILHRMYRNGILLWQETGMSDGLASIIQQVDSNVCIIHTPPNNEYPYGSAILWPRHKFGDHLWAREIIPGCVIAAGVNTADGPATIISVYAPNNRQSLVSQALKKYLDKWCNEDVVVVGGDFNFNNGGTSYQEAIHFIMAASGMRPAIGLHTPRDTFRCSGKQSYLDEVFIKYPSPQCAVDLQTTIAFPAQLTNEHARITVKLKITKYSDMNDYKFF